jgi:4-hydroxy-tetrahydrodipicolinate reductase
MGSLKNKRKYMTIHVIVNGALGKMGKHCVAAIEADPDLTLVAQGTRVMDLAATIKQTSADVVVDFTTAEHAFENTRCILENNARPVIGTSGLNKESVAQLAKLANKQKLGGLVAPNFAIGAVLMMKLAAIAAPYFSDAEIIEMHHQHKKDAPSGTATRSAEMLGDANAHLNTCRANQHGDQTFGVPIHSVRLPGVFTHQEVIFGATGETLKITHNCSDRKAAMPGVVLACKKVIACEQLVYGLEHLL